MKHSSRKNDIILVSALIAAGLIFALIFSFGKEKGRTVEVIVDGQTIETFSLSDDIRYEIEGCDGGHNLLVISDGSARIEEADCPDGLCVKMGAISSSGRSIVCLPHRVVIKISADASGSENSSYDITVK